MGGTGIWLAAKQLNIASVILQAICCGEKGHRFVAESTRRGAGRWVGGMGTPRTGRGLDQPLHKEGSFCRRCPEEARSAQLSCRTSHQAGCHVGPRMCRSPLKETKSLILP